MDDTTLTITLAQLLADGTGWPWRPTGPAYDPSEVGIYYGAIAPAPDQGVGLRVYYADDPHPVGVRVRRVQLRFRGARNDPASADTLAAAAFTALHGLARVAGLSLVTRVLVAQLGTDESARQERADSYQIILDNPEASS